MNRIEKEELVASMRQSFSDINIMVVTHYSGLTVAEMTELRNKMFEAGAGFRVTKNRLVRLALDGTDYKGLKDLFRGPTAIAYSLDPVAAAKVSVNFAKQNEKLIVLGGSLKEQALDVNGVTALAALPSLNELRAKIVGMINTPASCIARVVKAPAGQLARVLGAYASKNEAG